MAKLLSKVNRRKDKKLTDKTKMLANKTSSKVPKTEREKKMWINARRLVAQKTGRYAEEDIPWGLVQKIYKDEKKGNKIVSRSDIKRAKPSKTVRAYRTPSKINMTMKR